MRLYLVVCTVIAGMLMLGVSHCVAYRAGRAVEQASIASKINQENDDAGNAAEKWRADLRRCNDAGGLFNFETGSCDR